MTERGLGRAALTLIAPVDFGLADKGWRVDLVAAQEHVARVGVAAADVAGDVVVAPTVVPVVEVVVAVASAENSAELAESATWLRLTIKSKELIISTRI